MKKKVLVAPLVLALSLGLTACGSKEETKVEGDTPKVEESVAIDENVEAIEITAEDLSDQYRANEAIADKEFKKVVGEVTGTVEGFGEEDGQKFMILKGHEKEKSPAIICFGDFEGTNENDQVTVRGEIAGKVSIEGDRNNIGIKNSVLK